jgi:hypothetical protein
LASERIEGLVGNLERKCGCWVCGVGMLWPGGASRLVSCRPRMRFTLAHPRRVEKAGANKGSTVLLARPRSNLLLGGRARS